VQGPPPPWFFLAFFPIAASSAALVIYSVSLGVARIRGTRPAAQLAAAPDPRVALMQVELDDLRTQVERLTAAQSFYAQLQPPAAARGILPGEAASPLS